MEKERRILISFGAAALLGLLAGVAAPKLFHMGDGSYAGFFSLYSFGKFAQLPDSDFTQLFWYLLVKRLRLICFLWMSSYTPFWIFCASASAFLDFFCRRYAAVTLFTAGGDKWHPAVPVLPASAVDSVCTCFSGRAPAVF